MYDPILHAKTRTALKEIVDDFDNKIYQMVLDYEIDIDKDELVKALAYDRGQYEKGYADGKADAVVHGRWVDQSFSLNGGMVRFFTCSECGNEKNGTSSYCPNCGAKMDLKEGDKDG